MTETFNMIKKMKILTLSLCFTVFFVCLAASDQKEKITVTVTGQGAIEQDNISRAEQHALKHAFQLAIEKGLGTFVKSEMDSVKANPTKYGLGAAGTLKKSFDLMTFLSSNLPKQGATIGKTFTNLTKYATANEVSVTDADAEKIAAEMEKG